MRYRQYKYYEGYDNLIRCRGIIYYERKLIGFIAAKFFVIFCLLAKTVYCNILKRNGFQNMFGGDDDQGGCEG